MAANLTLDEFLKQLASQHGLHRKIRMLARYWRQVQSLPPEGRERVALALGSRAAWNRLEKLFNRDGTLSEGELAVKRALDSVGRSDPGELRTLARKVRSGDYSGIGRDLLDVVGKALDEEAEATEAGAGPTEPGIEEAEPWSEAAEPGIEKEEPRSGAAEPEIREAEPGSGAAEPEIREAEPGSGAAEPEIGESEPGTDVTRAGIAAGTLAADHASARSDAEFESDGPDELEGGIESGVDRLADELNSAMLLDRSAPTKPESSAPEEQAPPAVGGERSPAPVTSGESPWAEHAPETVTLSATECLAELRRLRDQVGYGVGLGADGRSRLLRRLGSGWAGRRGLSQLIRSGSIRDIDEALQLIDGLETPVQRSWCLGDLVEHWDLAETEAARILYAAPSSAARRRLQRRAEKRYRAQ